MSLHRKNFESLESIRELFGNLPAPDEEARNAALARNRTLTKPEGSLGRLDDLAVWYAGWRGEAAPVLEAPQILIFAGNHGVAARGVSAFPAEVTAQMVKNFQAGGAAINQLAALSGAKLDIRPLQLARPVADIAGGPAMTGEEFAEAFSTGWRAVDPDADVLIAGEMGIGNTTSAAAIAFALFGGEARLWVGSGTGIDGEGHRRKTGAVEQAVSVNRDKCVDGLDVLRCLGGREVAAMAGAILCARHLKIPVVLDGYVCTAAAAVLEAQRKGSIEHVVSGHLSAERPHKKLLDKLGLEPLIDLDMRLGEGSGAAVALMILKCAVACHSRMATFNEAGVSSK